MTDLKLDLDGYARFIREVYGQERKPFPWQDELLKLALSGSWPDTIAVPTGAGKTSAIDIAVYAMAACEGIPLRRIFFAVDRRVVVQEAYDSAQHLARKLLAASEESPVLYAVARRLRELAGEELLGKSVRPLEVYQLRGGIYREKTWARSPLQPVVLTTTVDQVGSRLLYRGYGSAQRAWAVQAGLVGNDSLIILDEAHCSNPFRQTLDSVQRFGQWGDGNLQRQPQFVFMSATPSESSKRVLELSEADKTPDALGPRLYARKLARLTALDVKSTAQVAQKLVELAETMAREGDLRSVGILVNRVATARAVYAELKSSNKLLLTGRMRDPDRARKYSQFKNQLIASPARPRPEECIFTVATQCIEVGANLDFEGLVTECASLDSLRQRFGRLDRLGLRETSPAQIVIQADQVKPKEPDPIYGEALPATWNWLNSIAEDGVVDFGIEALKSRLPDAALQKSLQIESKDAPILLPAYLDRWAQTSPPPRPDPDPAIFLHGPDQSRPDVSVIWRADLDYALDDGLVKENLSALLPGLAESASVPLGQFLRWLAGKDVDAKQIADLEIGARPEEEVETSALPRKAFLWRGPEDSSTGWFGSNSRTRLRPGDVLVVSALDASSYKLADFPGDEPLHWDLAELTQMQTRRKCAFRLHPEVLRLWSNGPLQEWCNSLLEDLNDGVDYLEDPERLAQHLSNLPSTDDWKWLKEMVDHWLDSGSKRTITRLTRESWILTSRVLMNRPVLETVEGVDDFTLVDDSSALSSRQVRLKEHCDGVARLAAGFARHCGLSPDMVRLFEQAGGLHDIGKADPRFQAWLFGGNSMAQQATGDLWAKSPRNQTKRERDRARKRAGYPQGGRHELVSARITQDTPELLKGIVDPELLIHLIAAHHGHARPFCPAVEDDAELTTYPYDYNGQALSGSVRSGLERLDSGQVERFWILIRRYGWWGLAWLESLLVLADHLQSEREREEVEDV